MYLVTAYLWYSGRGVGIYNRGVALLIGPVKKCRLGVCAPPRMRCERERQYCQYLYKISSIFRNCLAGLFLGLFLTVATPVPRSIAGQRARNFELSRDFSHGNFHEGRGKEAREKKEVREGEPSKTTSSLSHHRDNMTAIVTSIVNKRERADAKPGESSEKEQRADQEMETWEKERRREAGGRSPIPVTIPRPVTVPVSALGLPAMLSLPPTVTATAAAAAAA